MTHLYHPMKFKDCFINNNSCSEKYKEAHILSRAATMSLICGKVKSGLEVVHLGSKDNEKEIYRPKSIGWKKASAYHCFCHDHDNDLFKPIEDDTVFIKGNLEQMFLHSLRTFAYSYYQKKEEILCRFNMANSLFGGSNQFDFSKPNKPKIGTTTHWSESLRLEFWSYESVRLELLHALNNRDFHKLKFCYAIFNKRISFASAGVLMAKMIDSERNLMSIVSYNENDPILRDPAIFLTVVPEKTDRSIVIMSTINSDHNANLTLQRFNNLDGNKLRKALSSLIISVNKENTFFHPSLWNYMVQKGYDKQIIEELNENRGLDLFQVEPRQSKFDLFSDEFTFSNIDVKQNEI